LDGTKEFIKRNGEFTINIALIEDSHPVLGVVHVPALAVSYFAAYGVGAFKKDSDNQVKRIIVAHNCHVPLKIVTSRSHGDEGLERLLDQTVLFERIRMGSSLKFCLVAEGAAHLYPRLGPTMEWDTAAGQCVVEMAGGAVTDLQGRALMYNKPDLLNPPFIVSSSPDCPCQNFKSLFPTSARLQRAQKCLKPY
jgi:3'(2'), 5'-bisphosphate nucleotidase